MDLKPSQEKESEALALKLGMVSGDHPVWVLADLSQDMRRYYMRFAHTDEDLLQLPILLREYLVEARAQLDRLEALLDKKET